MIESTPKLLVAVTLRIDAISDRGEYRDAVDQRLLSWLTHAGYLPVPVPNIFFNYPCNEELSKNVEFESWLQTIKPNAVLLSGGNDIGEYLSRDATERYLLSWAEVQKLPVLGICRGLQMMAVWAGVDLVKLNGHVNTRHSLTHSQDSADWPDSVNSYHNWCLATCPEGFEIQATTDDGSIEAIRHLELPWEGWMWHPEREQSFAEQDLRRLKRLFGEQ
jgi:anthranilate/para-aminobenzoate synthase component II